MINSEETEISAALQGDFQEEEHLTQEISEEEVTGLDKWVFLKMGFFEEESANSTDKLYEFGRNYNGRKRNKERT